MQTFLRAFSETWMSKTSRGSRECLASFSVGLSVALSSSVFFFLLGALFAPTGDVFVGIAWTVTILLTLLAWMILLMIDEQEYIPAGKLFDWAVFWSPVGLTPLTIKAIVRSVVYVVTFFIEFCSNLRPATPNHSE